MAHLELCGDRFRPLIHLISSWGEMLPGNKSKTVNEWVRALPGRHWNPDTKVWVIDSLGKYPENAVARSGLELFIDNYSDDLFSLDDIVAPLVRLDQQRTGYAKVVPRLTGQVPLMEKLGPAAVWDKARRLITIPLADLADMHGTPRPDMDMPADVYTAVSRSRLATIREGVDDSHVSVASLSPDLKSAASRQALQMLTEDFGDIPAWFSLNLYEYQRLGSYAVAAGRYLLADQPGLGKCVLPGTRVLANGRYVPIESLWNDSGSYVDAEGGQWLDVPDCTLTVPSLNISSGATEMMPVQHIYREHIDASVRTVTTRSGSTLTCTQHHRFFTPDGWVRAGDLVPGMMVAAPGTQEVVSTYEDLGLPGSPSGTAEAVSCSADGHGFRWTAVKSVTKEEYSGWVYDLTVPNHHNYVAEGLWTHNTRQALAALALHGCRKSVLVVPPVVLTNWSREFIEAGLPGQPVIFSPTRKVPALPDVGAVVVSDSLLAARPQLLQELIAWAPDGMVYDEAHRSKSWEAARSVAVRDLAESMGDKPRLAVTGTPQTKTPSEIASMLAITGQLQTSFGSYSDFVREYCREDRFGNLLPRKKALPKLREILDREVWVRRYKSDVLKDLPPKQWHTVDVDVSLKEFRAAHKESLDTVAKWVDGIVAAHDRFPTDAEVEEYAQGNLGVISPMRKAAGVSKIEATADWVLSWVFSQRDADDEGLADDGGEASPLLVWCHHHDMMNGLKAVLENELACDVPILSGNSTLKQKERLVDGFQAGAFPVMICQITAAGVGITLTRANDAVFAETDWTDPLIQQAEDRCHRIGTTGETVTYTTLLAVGTLDEFIHKVRLAKKDIADVVVGRSDGDAADNTQRGRQLLSPSDLITDLVEAVVAKRRKPMRKPSRVTSHVVTRKREVVRAAA